MSKERHVFFCGGAKPFLESAIQGTELHIHADIRFEIGRFLNSLVKNLPDRVMDLLDIAAYVYVVDQMTSRGGDTFRQYGNDWWRTFDLYIAVRDLAFWQHAANEKALKESLNFVSGDKFNLHFTKQNHPEPVQRYFEFDGPPPTGFSPDTVMLFSGGLDSLAGAIEEGVVRSQKVALVTHCATSKLKSSQIGLYEALQKKYPGQFHQFPVNVNKNGLAANEYTQRTRSFLFASLAFAVATAFGLDRICFYENGIVSVNLPIAEQVTGSRASRTTHPRALSLYANLFTQIQEVDFHVESPFLYHTKTEIVQIIRKNGLGELIRTASSCAHTWEKSKMKTHCGKCSQCIDRRFATLAAGCTDDEDPQMDYELDLFTGERDQKPEHAQMLYGYVQQARKFSHPQYTVDNLTAEFFEINRILTLHPSQDRALEAQKLFELHQRHGQQVLKALSQGFSKHSDALAQGNLPPTCLLEMRSNELLSVSPEREDSASQYDLLLKPLCPKTNSAVAQLVGQNAFNGFLKLLGPTECFFMHHLCQSKATKKRGGKLYTVIAKAELLNNFKQVVLQGIFEQPRDQKINRRFNEYLRRFQTGINKPPLYGMLVCDTFSGRASLNEYLGIALPPESINSDINSLEEVLKTTSVQ